ncbi:MAG: thermonuclease family protein [Nannocystaceae bacterium]
MERETRIFWTIIAILLGASLFWGLGAEARRRKAQHGDNVALKSGEHVTLLHVLTGDTLMARTEEGTRVVIHLLGVRALAPRRTRHGSVAVEVLQNLVKDQPLRVLLPATGNDPASGRTVAELLVKDQNVGLMLIKQGLGIVDTRYPFPALSSYLDNQNKAREAHRGLWSDPEAIARADALARAWRKESS